MELVKTFGLNPILLVAQVVNFLILLYLLNRFLYKPVLTMLRERQAKIEQGLTDAKKGEELLEKAQEERQRILKEATTEAQNIIDEARKEVMELRNTFEEQTKQDRERMLEEATAQLLLEKEAIEKQIMEKVTTVASALLEKTLETILTGKEKKKMLEAVEKEFINKLPH